MDEKGAHSAHTIFVGNQKGGVGKTTNCVQLAAAFGALGRKCLIVDLDANQGSTLHLGVQGDAFLGTYEVLTGEEDPLEVIVDGDSGIDLIPAGRNLEKINRKARISPNLLHKPIQILRTHYDFIFFDTAPNLTVPTIASYYAADWFILSVVSEPFAITGLSNALAHIRSAIKKNRLAQLLGILFTCVEDDPGFWARLFGQQEKPDRSLVDYVDQKLKMADGRSLRFDSMISRSQAIPLCQMQGKTLFQTEPDHKITKQYRALALEIEARIRTFHSEET